MYRKFTYPHGEFTNRAPCVAGWRKNFVLLIGDRRSFIKQARRPTMTASDSEPHHDEAEETTTPRPGDGSSKLMSALKLVAASAIFLQAVSTYQGATASASEPAGAGEDLSEQQYRRRLTSTDGAPSYMGWLFDELKERRKLMEETPPEEVKYWFEYAGPLQKYFYRYSKSRGKADYFEGRDDSGVVSSRFFEEAGSGPEYTSFFQEEYPDSEAADHTRLLDNCLAMGSHKRPSAEKGTFWYDWYGSNKAGSTTMDRCRLLITLNMIGAGRGSTILWETNPPPIHSAGPDFWISEQETAATHLERNLAEIDSMCATGQIAARVQILVCEPIPGKWTDWMDSKLVNCGGKPAPLEEKARKEEKGSPYDDGIEVDDRPSPVQVVVVASADTADTCHDLKSGFMEKRMQDLILAPPYISSDGTKNLKGGAFDPAEKTTHPDLVSSDDHDVYIAMKWSSLVSTRVVASFLQASADLAVAASSPNNQEAAKGEKNADGVTVALTNEPSSPFLIPSFVRVSYVSEENNKVAKWRMHGDFFHPAAWEICKDSFDMTWIPDSLSGNGGVHPICYGDGASAVSRKLEEGEECGQWWVYFAEEQMTTTPEVYANEITAPLVQGGSNYFWMLTERQRQEVLKHKVCEHENKDDKEKLEACGESPQAVMPLGDLASFQINFTPNTALGKKHNEGRRPGYSRQKERERDRELVRERKQLKGQEDIEKALFDYTVYPSALFHKDATVKAARARDAVLTKESEKDKDKIGPQTVKSSYYDVTITKPREATSGWCQHIARKGLCSLYAPYFRESTDKRCMEACGLSKNWSKIDKKSK